MFLPRLCLGLGVIFAVQGANEDITKESVIFTEPVSWWEAKEACVSLGGQLTSLQTMEELANTLGKMKSEEKAEVWIGGTHIKGKPSWIDGENGQFNRSEHKFDNSWESENCLLLMKNNKIIDANCGLKKISACRKTSDVKCPEEWFNSDGKCFKFVKAADDVRKVCTEANPNATMGSISSAEEEEAVSKMAQSDGFYVGLYRSEQETNDQFVWADQMEAVWKKPNQTDATLRDECTFVNITTGAWTAVSCNLTEESEVLCQIVSPNLLDRLIFPMPVELFLRQEQSPENVSETLSTTPSSPAPSSSTTPTTVAITSEKPIATTNQSEASTNPSPSSEISNITVSPTILPVTVTMETSSAQLTDSQDPGIQVVELDNKFGNVSLSIGLGTFFVIIALIAVIAYITYYKKIRPARQFGFRSFDDSFA